MPDVEVKLNLQANFQAAMTAVANLAKSLDEVQQKAKLLPGGGAAGGDQRVDVDVSAAAANREAVAGLAAALQEAAVAATKLGLAVKSLGPGLKEMGPDGEQVQQVAALGGHYKELAAALGLAAEAAAKYKAADGGMKETDDRIRKLLAENEALMDRLTAVQNEYQMMVRSNAEREKERVMREENAKATQKETQATTDNDYQMKLAAMSKRELVAEIQRLTKARKDAAAAGNEYNYKEYGEQLRIARQELRKMNQEQQVNKIAFLQQAQVAQQMGANLRTLTDGVMSFGESLENGTLNLTGMASAAISLGMAIKAGLGPLGWALAAVEALTLAWNVYAKKRKEIEAAEAEQNKKAQELAAAYNDAADAVERLAAREVDLQKLNDLKQAYADLNTELRTRNDLLDASLRKLSAELAMRAKEEDFEKTLKRNEIMREFWSGRIDEEERDRRLDELNVTSAEQKRKRTMEKEQAELDAAQAREKGALDRLGTATGLRERLRMEKNRRFMLSPEEAEREYLAFAIEEKRLKEIEAKRKEYIDKIAKEEAIANDSLAPARQVLGAKGRVVKYKKILDQLNAEYNGERSRYDAVKDRMMGINPDYIESGRYKEQYNAFNERLKTANAEAESAKANYEAAQAATLAQQSERDLADAQTRQDVTHARGMVRENARQREAQRQFKKNEEERRRNEQFAAEARRQAERDARASERDYERFGEFGRKARVEARAEKRALKDEAFTRDAYGMLAGGIDAAEADRIIANMQDAKRKGNEALWKLVDVMMEMANDDKMTSESVLAKLQRERNKLDKRTKNMID
jgi:hypothetical protein